MTCHFSSALPSADVILAHANGLFNRNTTPTPARLAALGFGRRTVDAYRKRKRDVAASSLYTMIADDTGTLCRISLNPKKRDGRVQQRLLLAMAELKDNNINVTDRTMRRLGFSARSMLVWRQAQQSG